MTKVRWGLCATSVATLVLATVGCSSDADDCNFVRTCGGPVGGGGGADAGTPETGGASGASGSGSGGASGASGSGGTSGSGGASGAGGTAGASGARDAGPDVMDAPPACDPTKAPGETACVVDEQYGVFVSPSGNDSSGDGTREHPYQTLGKGLAAAKDATKRLYVCADGGSYGESVATTPDGAAVFAGFHCADWTWDDALRAKVESPGAIAWKIDSAQTGVVLQNLEIVAANAVGAGTSSIGVFVNASQNVALRHLKITAGNGAPGQGGTSIGGSAAAGAKGNDGSPACTVDNADRNPGGAAVETICGGNASGSIGNSGGKGGTDTDTPGGGEDGLPSLGGGGGGAAEAGALCVDGAKGTSGAAQPDANGAIATGSLAVSGFVPANGDDGLSGLPGQGGGGGGGAKATTGSNPCIGTKTGASGGSGGGGGCGGQGGGGGTGGGGSLTVVSVNSTVSIADSELTAGNGGRGGDGGALQAGGVGGDPGKGASGGTANESCAGGKGGKGGNGGNGGGGAGGPSVGIAYVGTAPTHSGNMTIQVAASAAPGGASGSGATTGSGAGVAGLLEQEHAF